MKAWKNDFFVHALKSNKFPTLFMAFEKLFQYPFGSENFSLMRYGAKNVSYFYCFSKGQRENEAGYEFSHKFESC